MEEDGDDDDMDNPMYDEDDNVMSHVGQLA